MNEFSIFDHVSTDRRTFFKFTTIGDAVEGTYIGREDEVKNMYGNLQTVIDLKTKSGEIVSVSISSTKIKMLEEMDNIKLGQIIGFKFLSVGKPAMPGSQGSKFIKIVQDPKFVDQAWLHEQEELQKQLGEMADDVVDPNTIFSDVPTTTVTETASIDTDKLDTITNLAAVKYNTTDVESIKSKIMEDIGVALIPKNFDLIIERLK